jgi:glycosyltransferase involved in cell wall biosynthesis
MGSTQIMLWSRPDLELLCFCHLRWNFVYQRPQHLMTRFGHRGQVHLWEEPIFTARETAALAVDAPCKGVAVITPLLPHGLSAEEAAAVQRKLLDGYICSEEISSFAAWYYTPMALKFSDHLKPDVIVYDCMDELSAFQGAPPELIEQEKVLFAMADVVFAGGASLYEAKREQHENVHLFPSSIDYPHFASARHALDEPADLVHIPRPRIGFYGVLDERLDRDLLREVAAAHPEWHFIMVGPVVKISAEDLPSGGNLHYPGQKSYTELPAYLAHWDVAMLPFARNASTRFISPTKTPEYLAAGKPVVSTPIRDVVTPYGEKGLVAIGSDAAEFSEAIEMSLRNSTPAWQAQVDEFLAGNSWDKTFNGMWEEIQRCMPQRAQQVPHSANKSGEEEHAHV